MTQKKSRVAEKELQSARRKRHHRQVMRNRIIFGIICAAVVALIIFIIVKIASAIMGAGYDRAEESTLTLNADGSVIYEEITDFDQDDYSSKELKNYVADIIDSYNETMGQEVITLDELKVKSDGAYMRTTYADVDTYTAFTSYQLYDGTVEDAIEAGYDFSDILVNVTDGEKQDEVEFERPSYFDGYNVAIIKENTRVKVPGTINYVSGYSTEMIDSSTVAIAPADGNMDATEMVYIIYTKSVEE